MGASEKGMFLLKTKFLLIIKKWTKTWLAATEVLDSNFSRSNT